jgi:hypothetical protein
MPPASAVVGLLLLPFVPLLARWAGGHGDDAALLILAVAGLLLSGVSRMLLRAQAPPPAATWTFVASVALLWGWFYAVDLHRARFALCLGLVPMGVLLAGRRNAALGAVLALTAIWALMVRRADNGCTGVSNSFGAVLVLHPVLALWPAPWLLSRADTRSVDAS